MSAVDEIVRDYEAAKAGSVFLRRPAPGVLVLIGDDAAEFLQGQVTNDIEGLSAGEGAYAALLTPKGKMRADMRILRTDDTVLILTDAQLLPLVRKTIDTFRIGFSFSTTDLSDQTARITLIGPSSRATLAALTSNAIELGDSENSNFAIEFAGARIRAIAISPTEIDLLCPAASVDQVVAAIEGDGALETTAELAEILRVEAGVPEYGKELDENTIPGEAGLNDRAVNFEKGCYVGQETVARMHYKGKPNRRLRVLKSDTPMTVGAAIAAPDGKELGTLGSSVVSPEHGPIGLAVVRREAETGQTVDVGGVPATVLDADSFRD